MAMRRYVVHRRYRRIRVRVGERLRRLALKLAVIPSGARNLALIFAPGSPRRRARFLASLGMTFCGFWVPVSRRA
jgi:hypothetical protein